MPLGVNLNSLTKVLKCAKDDDMVTIKASDDGDVLGLVYEARSKFCLIMTIEVSILISDVIALLLSRRYGPPGRVHSEAYGYRLGYTRHTRYRLRRPRDDAIF